MVKRQRNGTWVLFVIFGLAAVAALFMFSGSRSGLTGNVVVQQGYDETTCATAGYVWYNGVCYDTQPVCSVGFLELCLDEPTCTAVNGFWYNSLCNAETQPVCDAAHLSLCLDEPTCTAVNGFWYNSLCNAVAQAPCTTEWDCSAWGECSTEGIQTRTCEDANYCEGQVPPTSRSCTPGESTTTTEIITETTTTQENNIPTVCSPNQEACVNGGLYVCNTAGTGWDLKQACELGCAGNVCAVPVQEQAPAETCEDGIKNQDEVGVDCGGVCAKRCSIFTLAGSVVNGPVESGKQFFTNLFSNKTRMYLILGGVGVLVAGLVSYLVFFKKKFKFKFKKK
jgi:hypothetical protein